MKKEAEKSTIEVDYDWWTSTQKTIKVSWIFPLVVWLVSCVGWAYVLNSKVTIKYVDKPVEKLITKTITKTKTVYVDVKKWPDPGEVILAKKALKYLSAYQTGSADYGYYELLLKHEISPLAKAKAQRELDL